MRSTVIITLAVISAQAHATELVCFTVSSVTLTNMGQKIEHEVTAPDDLQNPEFYTIFDLAAGTTSLFLVDPDGTKTREINELKMIDEVLYVGEYAVGSEKHHTTYLFSADFSDGLLTEAGFVASFRCEQLSIESAEERYSIPFSEFEEAN